MHEFSLTCSIVEMVAQAARERRVRRVTLEVGELAGVLTEAIVFCFDEVAKGTSVEGAELEIRRVAAFAKCADCGAEFATSALYTPCACGSLNLTRLRGEELEIKSVELEAA